MRKITFFALLMLATTAQAQNFEWVQSPPVNNDVNNSGSTYPVTTDAFGNSYIAGFKDNAYYYSELLGTVQYNKYNTEGQLMYSKSISGRVAIHDLATDSQGNLVMVAAFNQSIGFENFTILSSNQGMKFIVLKFDPQGSLMWHLVIDPDDTAFLNEMNALAIDAANNIYIGYGDFMDSWITKLSPSGDTLLTIEQSEVNLVTSVSIDNAGNIYAAGSCASLDAAFAGVSAPTAFDYNTYIVKYSPGGAFQWVRYVDDITCSSPQVKAFSPDAVYFSSYLFGNYTFDAITTEGPSQNLNDFFLTKLNSSGNFQWVREVIGNGRVSTGRSNFLGLDTAGNVYFTGATTGFIDWGNGFTTSSIGFANNNALVLKYSPEGQVQMAKVVESIGHDSLDGVSVNTSGEIFVSGLMGGGTANFDNIPLTVPQYDYYPILAKISPAVLSVAETGIKKIAVYPNPSSDYITIDNFRDGKGSIFNSIGQKMMDFTLQNNGPIAISQLAKGAYIIRLDGHTPLKFIKG